MVFEELIKHSIIASCRIDKNRDFQIGVLCTILSRRHNECSVGKSIVTLTDWAIHPLSWRYSLSFLPLLPHRHRLTCIKDISPE